jgi:hypothetical protein
MQKAAPPASTRELSGSVLKRSIFLSSGQGRLRVDPAGTVVHLHSSRFGKLLFGRGTVEPFKVQAGVIIPQRQRETRVSLSPTSLGFSSAGQEVLRAYSTVRLCGKETTGYIRTVKYTNGSDGPIRLRVLSLNDPTTLNFRLERDPPGDVGVNAFNRGDHVVMDDVGDSAGVRVVGYSPRPTAVFLSRSRQKALELLESGELPESTAGMSGAILVMSQHDADLSPGASFQLEVTSVYHDSSLETALEELKSGAAAEVGPPLGPDRFLRCSSPAVNFAYDWAKASLGSVERDPEYIDRVSAGFGVGLLRPGLFAGEFAASKSRQRRDGLLPGHNAEVGGPMETSLFLIGACTHLSLGGDRRLARKWYPVLRKAANALLRAARGGLISSQPGSPDGWRRRLGSGYPTGFVAETNLIAARALADASRIARSLNKLGESADFQGASKKILDSVNGRLRDMETGSLALNLDVRGRLHTETTVDQAVALSFCPFDKNLASSTVHRLLEKDFETGFGPRTVSRTNALYYNPEYGQGQLGGFWTRASLSHAILSYASGNPSMGSAQLLKVADLVRRDCERMGGVPGEFPFWFDPDRRQIMSEGSDPVAASRFVEALMTGEAGLDLSAEGLGIQVPPWSGLDWLALGRFAFGGGGSLFVGRSSAGTLLVSSLAKTNVEGALRFQTSEVLESPPLQCVTFWDESAVVVCVGNCSDSTASDVVQVGLRGKPLAKSLYADLEEFQPESFQWRSLERRRLLDRMELQVELQPNAWKVFRFSQVRPPSDR